jgi:hypothetical protein
MQDSFEIDGFADKLIFSDEATFHLSRKVNQHSVRIWGTKNPCVFTEHVRDSPKVNVSCATLKVKVYGLFSFEEPTVTEMIYLDMVEGLCHS